MCAQLGAFLSGDGKLVLMTKDFETLAETVVEVTEFGASAFVNVGWGSKETQFHGSEGKEAAKAREYVTADVFTAFSLPGVLI